MAQPDGAQVRYCGRTAFIALIVATALIATLGFALSLKFTGLLRVTTAAAAIARAALAAVRDPALDDAARERAARAASGRLFGAALSITARGLASCLVLLAPLWLADAAGLAPWGAVTGLLASWRGVALASATGVVAFLLTRTS